STSRIRSRKKIKVSQPEENLEAGPGPATQAHKNRSLISK
ncbi:8639_t:CDS:1, partial [Funneliformis geosporum]